MNEIELCNAALIKLGAEGISSFDDASAEARVASRLYPLTRDAMLAAHPWTFALAECRAFDGMALPSRVLRVLSSGYAQDGRWIAEGQARCVVRVPAPAFPSYFTAAIASRLAAEFCLPLTENSSRTERLSRMAEAELKVAKLVDSQQRAEF